jgi:hypothetical protein
MRQRDNSMELHCSRMSVISSVSPCMTLRWAFDQGALASRVKCDTVSDPRQRLDRGLVGTQVWAIEQQRHWSAGIGAAPRILW